MAQLSAAGPPPPPEVENIVLSSKSRLKRTGRNSASTLRKRLRSGWWSNKPRSHSQAPVESDGSTPGMVSQETSRLESQGSSICNSIFLRILKAMVTDINLRIITGFTFTFGLLCLILMYQNQIPPHVSLPVSCVLSVVLTSFYALSKTIRCVMILSVPSFGTQQGRYVFFAIITGILVGGPLTSFSTNLCEFGKSAKCMSLSTLKQGQEMMAMNAQSYEDAFEFIEAQIGRLNEIKLHVDNHVKPVKDLLLTLQDKLGNVDAILAKAGKDCQLEVVRVRVTCVIRAIHEFKRCKRNSALRGLSIDHICEVIWTSTDICYPALNENILCFPVKATESVAAAVKSGLKTLEEALDFEVIVERDVDYNLTENINATAIEEEIRTTFQSSTDKIQTIAIVMKYFFLSSIAWIPLKSWLFLRKVRANHRSLDRLPEYNRKDRRKELRAQGFLLFIHLLFTLTIFGVDYACYWVQNSVLTFGENGSITVQNSYAANVSVSVGSGLLLNPVVDFENSFFKSLNMQKNKNFTFHAAANDCFPKPVESSSLNCLVSVLTIYSMILLLLIQGNRVLKYRLNIVHFVMPELKPKEDPTLIPFSVSSTFCSTSEPEVKSQIDEGLA